MSASPYIHGGRSIGQMMLWVIVALLPALGWGVYQYGWAALIAVLITLLFGVGMEAVALFLRRKPVCSTLLDGSAVVTCLLLAMALPAGMVWWVYALGAVVAVGLAKQLYGGLGLNAFNPAMVGWVFLMLSFPKQITIHLPAGSGGHFQQVLKHMFESEPWPDAITQATQLDGVKHGLVEKLPYEALFMGFQNGAIGEASGLFIVLGGLVLVAKKATNLRLPVGYLAGVVSTAYALSLVGVAIVPAYMYILGGGTLFAAFFIVTDPVTSPAAPRAQWLFAVLAGVLSVIIGAFGQYPVGIAFAILLMNAASPLLDRWLKPRIYGKQ